MEKMKGCVSLSRLRVPTVERYVKRNRYLSLTGIKANIMVLEQLVFAYMVPKKSKRLPGFFAPNYNKYLSD